MKKTIGGNRLGSGKKMTVDLKSYERSTHDLGYIWRSTMAAGTLVPFMSELGLPGDTFDIDLECDIKTHPTIGPLFGSYKVQLDVFQAPVRLYQAQLHNNKLGIGMEMANIKLPQINMRARAPRIGVGGGMINLDEHQINPSSIFSYLGINGLGHGQTAEGGGDIITRRFNAVPWIAYWDIYKNYYANKQEEIGAVIHTEDNQAVNYGIQMMNVEVNSDVVTSFVRDTDGNFIPAIVYPEAGVNTIQISGITLHSDLELGEPNIDDWYLQPSREPEGNGIGVRSFRDSFNDIIVTNVGPYWQIAAQAPTVTFQNTSGVRIGTTLERTQYEREPEIQTFPLSNLDDMREEILQKGQETAFSVSETTQAPYGLALKTNDERDYYSKKYTQEGLGLKTYQSDLFNNWMSTEWIDGENGISAITSIDTSEGSFSIDTLNLSKKVYDMLNRIAISGGSYDDWLDAVYTHDRVRRVESPIYQGGLIRELVFSEVVSTAEAEFGGDEAQPLGTLAGKGIMGGKKKGGKVRVKIDEPSYVIGIISLTPRVDYSQGNKWDTNLETMDDFHKPALDQIGFQDLVTDQMAYWETKITGGNIEFKSAGKQPAWINYMTNVNQAKGNFAIEGNEMFMTLNRRYEIGRINEDAEGLDVGILDLTTYIDPVKFNHIFAYTKRDAQNFWAQIGVDIKARRKMSAKVMPNL